MRFWEEMQEPANLQENHKIMLGNPDLVGESAYQSTDLNRLRGFFGGVVQISTQSDLDAFRPESGFAIVIMGDDIDTDIKTIFGTDNNKIEIHAYTIAGTGSSAGDVYQQGVSAINGLTYRRSYNNITGWTDFELAIDISRKIDFIDWSDLAPYYTALVGRFYKVHGTGGDATSEYWYLCIQNYTGFQVDVDYTNSEYFYPISNGALADIALTRKIDFIDWGDLEPAYTALKGRFYKVHGTGGDSSSEYWYICIQDFTGLQEDVDYTNPVYFFDITGHTHAWSSITGKPSTFTPSAHNHLNDTLKPNAVEYQSGATPPTNAGSTYYDDTYKVLSTVLGNGVVLQNGLEMYVRVVNKTGSQLNDGQVVYISGAQGNRPTASLAIATSEQASYVIGVCTENITNNQEGFVTVFGTVNGYNTSSFTDGAKLYLSATVAGGLTTTRPVAPNHGVIVGIALNSTNNGAIFVNPNSGFELSELHDVDTSKTKNVPLDADYLLMQDTADSNIWKKVLKANTNEIYVGSGTPSHNEVLIIDNSSDLLVFGVTTGSNITPNFKFKIDKYTSNYAGGNTVVIDFPIWQNTELNYDDERVLIVKNLKSSPVTFVISTGSDVVGTQTFNYEAQNVDEFVLAENQYAEISYLFCMTSATTATVLIRWAKTA